MGLFKDDEAEARHDANLRDMFTVKGVSGRTMDAIQAGEVKIVSDDDQAEILKQLGGQT